MNFAGTRRAVSLGLLFTLLVSVVVGALPGFRGPGYELALVLGFLLPSAVAATVARDRLRDPSESPIERVVHALWLAAAHAAIVLVVATAHGLASEFCDPWAGFGVVVLGPIAGVVLAAVWGALASELTARVAPHASPRRAARLGTAIALFAPLGSIGVGLWRFYGSPIIFGYDPFVGYFSGTLYDTVLHYDKLLTYRVGSAASLGFVLAASALLERDADGRAVLAVRSREGAARRAGALLLALAFGVASIAVTASGPALGHWHTRASIEKALGGKIEGDRCDVVHDRTLARADVLRFHAECEVHLAEVEAWWGERGPEKITAFLFEDEDQKAGLMGAAGTNIAKPWRAEVYVQGTSFPHRVIGHELMHVVAASRGEGPFRVAANFAGTIPNPGLIEGVAVAASPKEDDLTLADWAKAMKDEGLLPPLEQLFGLSFFGSNHSMAYSVSGAFVGWVHGRFGSEAVRRWYGGEPLAAVTGVDWATMEREWHAALDALVLGEAALVQVRAKFDRPGFFARRCPRKVDECRDEAASLARAGDVRGALHALDVAARYEPKNPELRIERAETLAKERPEEAERLLRTIADDDAVQTFARDLAREAVADLLLAGGRPAEAAPLYREVASRTVDEAKLRTLYVKLEATRRDDLRPAVVELLVGAPGREPDRGASMFHVGGLASRRADDGLLPYLAARYFVERSRYAEATTLLAESMRETVTVPKVRAESIRLLVIASCAVGDVDGVDAAMAAYEREAGVSAARLGHNRRLAARCHEMPKVKSSFVEAEVAE
jgi:hypothetical protein